MKIAIKIFIGLAFICIAAAVGDVALSCFQDAQPGAGLYFSGLTCVVIAGGIWFVAPQGMDAL